MLIALALSDNTIRIWGVDLGDCVQNLKGRSGLVLLAAFLHDLALIASAAGDQTVRIWHVNLGECI